MSLDDLQAQLRGALDQQFAVLKQQYDQAIAEARRQARVEADRDAAAQLEASRADWERQLESLIAATRAEAQEQAAEAAAAERQSLQQQFEQRAVQLQQTIDQRVEQAAESARRSAELEIESERRRSQNVIEAERQRATGDLDALKRELTASRQAAVDAAAKAAPAGSPAVLSRLPDAIRALDSAKSLSQALDALLQHAGAIAGRAALFLVNGDRLKSWKTMAIPEIDVQTVESSIGGRDLLARAIQAGQPMPASQALPAPPFARLTGDHAVAVPMMIGGRAVGVLYADTGGAAPPAAWADAVELIARHASAVAAVRAAMRTLDVLRGETPEGQLENGNGDESARRYARLLVSEIKLYNEAAVRTGRQQRDLRQRLRGEIDRAQRLYEERVPAAIAAREQYFHQELVQTLADGDPSLLGN